MKLFTCPCATAAVAAAIVGLRAPAAHGLLDFGEWEDMPDMAWPTSDMTVTEVAGFAYIIGGCVADQLYVESWGIYTCGGLNGGVTDEAWAYNLATGANQALQAAPRQRYRHTAVAIDGEVYVIGGTDDSENPIYEVDVYNIFSGVWRTEAAMNMTSPVTDAAAFTVGTKVHVVGGYEHMTYVPQSTTQVFDVASPESGWATLPGGALGTARGDFGVVQFDPDGDAYAIGGYDETFAAPLTSTEVFDVASSSWSPGPSLVVGRADKAMAVVNGSAYVLGGETTSGEGAVVVNDIEYLSKPDDDAEPAWQQDSHVLQLNKFRFSALSYNGRLFVFGGQGFLEGPYANRKSFYRVHGDVNVFSLPAASRDGDNNDDEGHGNGGAAGAVTVSALAAAAAAAAAGLVARR